MITESPKSIKAELDKHVMGQEEAKWKLATAFYLYSAKMQARLQGEKLIMPCSVMLTGESGCGKTLMATTLAKVTGLPILEVDCSLITNPGYKGKDINETLWDCAYSQNISINTGQPAILFLDEIDKLNCNPEGNYGDFNRGMQATLLKLIEDAGAGKCRGKIDSSNWFIVAAGAFSSMNRAVSNPEDLRGLLVKEGIIKELLNRFMCIVQLTKLSPEDALKVAMEAENGPFKFYKRIFEQSGQEFELSDLEMHDLKQHLKNKSAREINGVMFDIVLERLKDLNLRSFLHDKFLELHDRENKTK